MIRLTWVWLGCLAQQWGIGLRFRLYALMGAIAIGVAATASTATTTLDFEDVPDGTSLTNQYQSRGVTISGVTAYNTVGHATFPPVSGTNVAYSEGLAHFQFNAGISGNVTSVSAYLSGVANVGIFAFDSANNQVAQSTLSSDATNAFLSVTTSGNAIAKIQIHNGGTSFAIDDLSFTSTGTVASLYGATALSLGGNAGTITPQGINASGQAAGTATLAGNGRRPGELRAFAWLGSAIQDLGTLGGRSSMANAINPSGKVVGTAQNGRGQMHAFLWTAGDGMIDLGTLGGNNSVANAINGSGQIVGTSQVRRDGQHAFLWINGGLTDLGTLGGSGSSAAAINDAGRIVGAAQNRDGQQRAFSWMSSEGMVDLGTLGGKTSAAAAVNSDGRVIGSAQTASGQLHAFAWPSSDGMADLGTLGGKDSTAVGINNSGEVIGRAQTASGTWHAFLWRQTGGGMLDLGTLGGKTSTAAAINYAGVVVGTAQTASGEWRAFAWSSVSGMVDLNSRLTGAPAGIKLSGALAVSDDGAIVVQTNQGLMLLRPQ
ncbi:hypothetical protein JHS3_04280 [Jeongeupia sp. HS-3]|nr:hypothetical protein JHS3_04280 [Jeongeupia sp. HS-3]